MISILDLVMALVFFMSFPPLLDDVIELMEPLAAEHPIIAFALSLSAFIVLMTLRITRAMHINGINLGRGSQRIRHRPPTDRNPVNVDGAGNRPVAVRGVSSNKGGHGNSGAEDEAMSANDQCISTNESNSGDSDGVGDEAQGELQNVSCYSSDEGSPDT